MIYIGIDPGVNTGFALVRDGKLETVCSFTAVQAENVILAELKGDEVFVYVEDARLMGAIPSKYRHKGKDGQDAKKEQGVGSVKRDSQRWHEWLIHHNIPHMLVSPRANRYKKCDADLFKRLTGWEGKSNEHGRDAACLLIGKINEKR